MAADMQEAMLSVMAVDITADITVGMEAAAGAGTAGITEVSADRFRRPLDFAARSASEPRPTRHSLLSHGSAPD